MQERRSLLTDTEKLRQRPRPPTSDSERWQPSPDSDWDPNLPYGGKVNLARRKKGDPWYITALEIIVIIAVVGFAYYAFYYFDHLHFNITYSYAKLGYADAQHHVGQRYLQGAGVDKDHHQAMDWFKKASDQGHPHAAYNLAIGHLKGLRTDILKPGDAHQLIHHAASKGVKEAHKAMHEICSKGGCDH